MNDGVFTPNGPVPRTVTAGVVPGRRYAGRQSSERSRERYEKFIEAGTEAFGTVGYAGAKVKTLCQGAGLSERYFYESFDSREHLLTVVYRELAVKLLHNVTSTLHDTDVSLAEAVRSSLASVVNFMLGDPRHARIMMVEVVGVSAELEEERHKSLQIFADHSMAALLQLASIDSEQAMIRQKGATPPETAPAGPAPVEPSPAPVDPSPAALDFARLTAISMVGGVNNMLLDAVLSGATHNTELIIEVSYQLLCNASAGVRKLLAAPAQP